MSFSCAWFVDLAVAQTVFDPGFVEFTASADHNALDTNGLPKLTRYEFLLYVLGTSTPLRVVNLGKPVPNAAGTIRIALSTILNPLPAGGITYEVRITAVGANGSSVSPASNSFAYQSPCTYAVSPTSRSLGSAAGSNTFAVSAPVGCAWTAASAASWITVTNATSGSGNGTVTFSVSANSTTSQRTGSMTIAGQSVSVAQSGGPCNYSVTPARLSVARPGGSASFTVASPAGCGWSVSAQSAWIRIASAASGTGNGTVTFAVAASTTTASRSATAMIAGQPITISQPPAAPPAPPTGMRIVIVR